MTKQEEQEKLKYNFSKTIIRLRRDNNVKPSQKDLADDMDISVKYYREMEKGKRMPSLYMMVKLARSYGMSLSDFCKELNI